MKFRKFAMLTHSRIIARVDATIYQINSSNFRFANIKFRRRLEFAELSQKTLILYEKGLKLLKYYFADLQNQY